MPDQSKIQNQYGNFVILLVIGLFIAASIVFGVRYFGSTKTTSVQNTTANTGAADMMRVVSGDISGPPPNAGGTPPAAPL